MLDRAMLSFLIALALLTALGLVVLLPRNELPSPTLALLRVFFPAWRFFEEIAPCPVLSHRVTLPGQAPGPWVLSLPSPARTAGALWLNAVGNLHLAQKSLLERLYAEIGANAPDVLGVTQTVSYQLVQTLVVQRVRTGLPLGAAASYQFRLNDFAAPETELFVSGVHPLA
jgi:hypothetical protein